ncbi:hypothetical protein Drorol1_Dr00007979 [Drosera rotundifolia]
MGEESTPQLSRAAAARPSRFADQNQMPRSGGAALKVRSSSSFGSQLVKGFAGEKKATKQLKPGPTKKVHPQALCGSNNYNKLPPTMGSCDLLVEMDNLRGLLKASKERESKLHAELSECKGKLQKSFVAEVELEAKRKEVEELCNRVNQLESEKAMLEKRLLSLTSLSERRVEQGGKTGGAEGGNDIEVVRLRRLSKELQLQKRDLSCQVASLESRLKSLTTASEQDVIAKIKAEASSLRHANEDLSKQVEGLQSKRLNEVEELAYLRWVNSCLRDELHNSCTSGNPEIASDSSSVENTPTTSLSQYTDSAKSFDAFKKLKKCPTDVSKFNVDRPGNFVDKDWEEAQEGKSLRRLTIGGCHEERFTILRGQQLDSFRHSSPPNHSVITTPETPQVSSFNEPSKLEVSVDVEKRELRVPNPPPRPSSSDSAGAKEAGVGQTSCPPPPPPPPPPPRCIPGSIAGTVQRAPEVVQLYHSLMKRESRKDSSTGTGSEAPVVANVRSSMIGEIENRSSYLLAIKADVETQGEFVNSLIKEVNNAVYKDIEDVVAFVKWLDDELCFLVDERAVLKHFEWPEKKADTLREAAFGYKDLKKLEEEVIYYNDDPRTACDVALKKMVSLSEKIERTIHNLFRTRESLMRNCKEFQIPTDWMLDNGIISKVKLGSVKLAKKYMKRVAIELQSRASSDKDPGTDYMLLQGVRFAFRIHQFAGGFDAETMQAFEELRKLANAFNK